MFLENVVLSLPVDLSTSIVFGKREKSKVSFILQVNHQKM